MPEQGQSRTNSLRDTIVAESQVYGDERHSEIEDGEKVFTRKFEIVHQDESRLLLRSLDDGDNYRMEPQEQFRAGIGSRWVPLKSGDEDELLSSLPDLAPVIASLKHWRRNYADQSGETAAHKAEALSEAIDIVSGYSPAEVDWSTVDGIGKQTADNLTDAGIVSEADARSADDETLLAITGVGQQTLDRLRDAVEENQTTVSPQF